MAEKEESFLNFIIENIFDGVIFFGVEKDLLYMNSAVTKILEVEQSQISYEYYEKFVQSQIMSDSKGEERDKKEGQIKKGNKHIFVKDITYILDGKYCGNLIILRDITKIKDSEIQLKELKYSLDMIEDILDYAYEGIVLVDGNGKIVKMNYEKLLGIKEEDALGKKVQDVIENTRMHIVAKTGKKEIHYVQKIQGHDMITNRIPIIRDGKVIGAVGTVLFKDAAEVKDLAKDLAVLEKRINGYKGEIERLQETKYSFDSIITQNPKMEYLKKIGRKAAESNSTVLITGESGTGKEMFAHSIHKASYRKYESFLPINCAAIPRELLESELFGYEQGAFTGAKKGGKPGKFELANGGTIFLDEIGSMPLEMQAKLLRVLEDKEVERVGGTDKISLDIRIIAATNENLDEEIKNGRFREDLFYRLNVISIDIPPLRYRREDIPLLAESIFKKLLKELRLRDIILSKEDVEILSKYNWPGNVRELRNVLERALNLCSEGVIYPKHISEHIIEKTKYCIIKKEPLTLKDRIQETEIKAIRAAIVASGGNKTLAAKKLGIHRTALYKKIEKYKLMDSI